MDHDDDDDEDQALERRSGRIEPRNPNAYNNEGTSYSVCFDPETGQAEVEIDVGVEQMTIDLGRVTSLDEAFERATEMAQEQQDQADAASGDEGDSGEDGSDAEGGADEEG